jgi:CubicO group peptidase (beta-lactamase class C family)
MPFAPDPRLVRWNVGFATALIAAFAHVALAQDPKPAQPPAVPSVEQRVDAFVAQLEAKRKELGVPGAALVIVQGDRILHIAGLGLRTLEPPEPVTADTVFMLASVTKQFTAIAVALAVSEGKMAFEDHPRKYVPTFRLRDPEADTNLNMIDLLTHRSGLGRSDVTFLAAPFTQAEMFELAYRAKPAAKFRTKYIYSNTMYALAGAAVGRAYGTTYERFVTERLFQPLGMRSSTATFAEFRSSANRAVGYMGAQGAYTPAKPADLTAVAGAGSLNSTARDVGAWLRFLNARGRLAGALEISPAAYARVFDVHYRYDDNSGYGLGFELQTRSGVLVASHGGNLPGYTTHVVHVAARGLSFALLTNLNNAPLPTAAETLFWDTVVKPELPAAAAPPTAPTRPAPAISAPPISPDLLIGTYFATQGGEFEVKKTGGGLVAILAGQPHYPLKAAGANVYDLGGLDGFSLAFAESEVMPGRMAVLLRQPPTHPGGNIDFLKKDEVWLARAKAQYSGPDPDLIGHYHIADRSLRMEIAPYRQGVALVITAIPPLPLVKFGGDLYRLEGKPETYRLTIKRSAGNRVLGFTYEQPGVRDEMIAEASSATGDTGPAARDLLDRAVAAAGGAEALDRIATRASIGRANAETLGIDGRIEDLIVPGKRAELLELGAFGKLVVKARVLTNERQSLTLAQDEEPVAATGKGLAAARFFAVPHPLYRWKDRFASVATAGEVAINGENAYVVELTPRGLAPLRLFLSAQSLMILREETPSYVGDELQSTATAIDHADYRVVNGVRLPFAAAVTIPLFGRIAITYDTVTLDAPIDPKVFEAK